MIRFIIVIIVYLIIGIPTGSAQTGTRGRQFWVAYPSIPYLMNNIGEFIGCFYIMAESSTRIRAMAPTINWDTTCIILPGLTAIPIPYRSMNAGTNEVHGYGVYLEAEDSVSVTVNVVDPSAIGNSGQVGAKASTLLFPLHTLGYEYYTSCGRVMHGGHPRQNTSQFLIVATEDNTLVEITPSDTTRSDYGPGYPVSDHAVGEPYTITLNKGELYGLISDAYYKDPLHPFATFSDLTGSRIRSSAPVAVFGGAIGNIAVVDAPSPNTPYDVILEQTAPVGTLGREHILTPALGTTEPFLCRIFALYDSTRTMVNGTRSILLRKGEQFDTTLHEPLYLLSDKPVNVTQYIGGMAPQDSTTFIGCGIAAIQPLEQILLLDTRFPDVPFDQSRRQLFVNIVTEASSLSSPIELDGQVINDSFVPVPSHPKYSYTQQRIPYGRSEHRVTALQPFFAYVYGTGTDVPKYASQVYFHSLGGGMNNLLLTATASADTVCPDSTMSFHGSLQMSLDTAGATWLWDFGDGNTAEGRSVRHSYTTSGTYSVRLTVSKGGFPLVDPARLTVVVAEASLHCTRKYLDFGRIKSCSGSFAEQEIELYNPGIRTALASAGWASSDGLFSVEVPSFSVAAGDTTSLRLRFRSSGIAGVWRDTLLLSVEPCGNTLSIPVVAEVLPGSVSASAMHLGVLSGCSQVQKDTIITVSNTGEYDVTLTGVTADGGYSVLNLASPVVVPVRRSYDLAVRFLASGVGVYNNILRLAYEYGDCRDTLGIPVSTELRGIPIAVTSGGDTTFCAGGKARLWADGGVKYQWLPLEGLDDATSATPIASPSQTTVYTVIVTNESGCTGSSVVLVNIEDAPVLQVSDGVRICSGGEIRLRAEGAERYQWSPSEGLDNPSSATPVATPHTTTVYTVTGLTGECSTSASVLVEVLPLPVVMIGNDTLLCQGESVRLVALSPGVSTYRWFPETGLDNASSATPQASPSVPTQYEVEVTDADGCSSTASVFVDVVAPVTVSVVVPDLVEAGRSISIPVRLQTPQQLLPLEQLRLLVEITYPARMLLVESVDGATLVSDDYIDADVRRLTVAIDPSRIERAEQDVCYLRCRTLLSAQTQGKIQPSEITVVSGRCVQPDSKPGLLHVEGFCQNYDLRRFQPLQVDVQSSVDGTTVVVQSSESGVYTIEVYDVYARLVGRHSVDLTDNQPSDLSLDFHKYISGVYILRVSGMQQSVSLPLLIGR